MLVITKMRDLCSSIIFCYYIIKPNILFPYYTPNIIYLTNYILLSIGLQMLFLAFYREVLIEKKTLS